MHRFQIMLCDMSMASKHLLGALQIIHVAGGLEILDLSRVVRCVLHSCIYGKGLLDGNPLLNELVIL